MKDMQLVLKELERQRLLNPQPPVGEIQVLVPDLSTESTGDPVSPLG